MIFNSDCMDIMKNMDNDTVDAVITDGPYGLNFMGKEWDHGIPGIPFWKEMMRVSKPGAYLLSFGGTRTYHRMACAVEDAGWEIRDCLYWVHGQGFPKSLDVSKAIDKAAGVEREIICEKPQSGSKFKLINDEIDNGGFNDPARTHFNITSATTIEAKQWDGWGTALKPSVEPICMARKPFDGTVAQNVLKWGVGALNIDACRIPYETKDKPTAGKKTATFGTQETISGGDGSGGFKADDKGRWPSHLIHDGSDEVVELFPITKPTRPHDGDGLSMDTQNNGWGFKRMPFTQSDNGGSAARFFYCAKPSQAERNCGLDDIIPQATAASEFRPNHTIKAADGESGNPYGRFQPKKNNHCTVKPVALLEYLIKMVSREKDIVLDPFMGSGTTGVACRNLKRTFIGIEKEKEYFEISQGRIRGCSQ